MDANGASPDARCPHGSVFTMGTSVWVAFTSLLLLGLLLMSVLFELALRWFERLPSQYQPIVQKIKDELLLMGAISLLLVVVEASLPIKCAATCACALLPP